jgi:hypothetical protein
MRPEGTGCESLQIDGHGWHWYQDFSHCRCRPGYVLDLPLLNKDQRVALLFADGTLFTKSLRPLAMR